MATTRRGGKLELELLPEELYGNIRGTLRSREDAAERLNPALQGGIFEQLYHRNVYHIAVLYVLLCWVVVEIAPPLFKELQFPSWISGLAGVMAVLGFPVAMLFAWSKDLTALGWKSVKDVPVEESLAVHLRTQLNRTIILVLGVGVVYLAVARIWFPARDTAGQVALASAPTAARPAPPASSLPLASASPMSIAVLPFADVGDAKDLGYLANGLSEELIPVLATLPQFAVTSSDSSFRASKNADVDAVATGAALGVQYLVGGSVRRVDGRAQVTVQLMDARDGSQRWTESFDREIGSAFQLREDIAAGVAKALGIPIGADGLQSRRVVRNPEALEFYLRGRQAFLRGDRVGYEQAADHYKQALDLEPQSATIEAALAELDLAMVQRGYLAPQIGVERARQAAETARALDVNNAKVHRLLGWIYSRYDWDWHAGARELELARSLEPHDPRVLADLGYMSLANGQFDSAAQNLQAALLLDPLDPAMHLDLGMAQFWGGHLPQAEAELRRAMQREPNLKLAHYYLGKVLLAAGDQQGALAEEKSEPDARRRLAGMAEVLYAMGRKPESDALLAQLRPLATAQWGSGLAGVYASRNEPDAAFQWLDRAYAQRDTDLLVLRGNPSFRNVSSDPRFLEFQRKMNLPG